MKATVLFFLLMAWGTEALSQSTGLEEFNVQNVAYVEIKGVVKDARDSRPIAGATVLAVWEATSYGIHSSSRHCLRAAAAQTNAQGMYSIVAPADSVFRRGLAQQYVDVRIHKAGMYEPATNESEYGRILSKEDGKRFSMAALAQAGVLTERRLAYASRMLPSKEDRHERMRTLYFMSEPPSKCETIGEHTAIKTHFLQLADEAEKLAQTQYEKALAKSIRDRATRAIELVRSDRYEDLVMRDYYRSADDESDLDARDFSDKTPLMNMVEAGNVARVNSLLQQGANPNRTFGRLQSGSALTLALDAYSREKLYPQQKDKKYRQVIEALLKSAAITPDAGNWQRNYTPLMLAIQKGQADVMEMLLEAGADPNLMAFGKQVSPLKMVIKNNLREKSAENQKQLSVLLKSGKVDLNAFTTDDWRTPLTETASSAAPVLVRQLLEAGADVNALDGAKQTPLIAITTNALLNPQRPEYAETFKLLANWPQVRTDIKYQGKTVMEMARNAHRKDLVQILVESGHAASKD